MQADLDGAGFGAGHIFSFRVKRPENLQRHAGEHRRHSGSQLAPA